MCSLSHHCTPGTGRPCREGRLPSWRWGDAGARNPLPPGKQISRWDLPVSCPSPLALPRVPSRPHLQDAFLSLPGSAAAGAPFLGLPPGPRVSHGFPPVLASPSRGHTVSPAEWPHSEQCLPKPQDVWVGDPADTCCTTLFGLSGWLLSPFFWPPPSLIFSVISTNLPFFSSSPLPYPFAPVSEAALPSSVLEKIGGVPSTSSVHLPLRRLASGQEPSSIRSLLRVSLLPLLWFLPSIDMEARVSSSVNINKVSNKLTGKKYVLRNCKIPLAHLKKRTIIP